MAQIDKLLIVCGEPSGDLLAGNLASEIKKIDPGIKISGVGGSCLKESGAQIICDIKELSVMGLFDVLKKLPRFFRLKKTILERIKTDKPEAIIFVDFSGFNLRLAKAINKSIPAIYYVSPQVWASREKRIESIRKYISRMIVLFKFEEEFYEKHGIKADYAGHPLLDLARPQTKKDELIKNLGIDSGAKIISLLPGSRKQEIRKILPLMLETAELINREIPDTRFIIAKSPNVDMRVYEEECGKSPLKPSFVEGKTCDCLNAADFSLVCSGTATLEAAIIQKPFVIVYKMNALNYLLYRPQVKIPYIGIVNIIAGRKIVPEYIQYAARPQIIAGYAAGLLRDPGKINDFRSDLSSLKRMLGEPGASARAARLILDFLKQ